jgi:hypothetical protein
VVRKETNAVAGDFVLALIDKVCNVHLGKSVDVLLVDLLVILSRKVPLQILEECVGSIFSVAVKISQIAAVEAYLSLLVGLVEIDGVEIDDDPQHVEVEGGEEDAVGIVDFGNIGHANAVTHAQLLFPPLCFQIYAIPHIIPFVLLLLFSLREILGVVEGQVYWLGSVEIYGQLVLLFEALFLFIVYQFQYLIVELHINLQDRCYLCRRFL